MEAMIVEDINNGKVINKLFNQWSSIKNEQQHKDWVRKVAATKFGTYKTLSLLDIIEKFNCKFTNEIEKRDFLREVKNAYNN